MPVCGMRQVHKWQYLYRYILFGCVCYRYVLWYNSIESILMLNFPSVVKESDFVNYNGAFGDKKEINADVEVASLVNFKMGAELSSTLELSFGKLKKEEVDVTWLHNNSKDKLLDMSHYLIQEARNKSYVFGVVMERIVTSEPCSITEKIHQAGNFGAGGKVTGVPVSVKGKVDAHGVKDESLVIPGNTVIAYSINEIMVKLNGHFEMRSIGNGGFEKNWTFLGMTFHSENMSLRKEIILHRGNDATGRTEQQCVSFPHFPSSWSIIESELEKLSSHFQVLSSLPTAKRSSLLQLLQTTMEDREAVSVLENVLDQMLVMRHRTWMILWRRMRSRQFRLYWTFYTSLMEQMRARQTTSHPHCSVPSTSLSAP
uniref:Gasdermin pore forming domain-containing protein n=1 Tax=Hucho hucho TaxID=62062 RepID=A0A4W5J8V0_9TELE